MVIGQDIRPMSEIIRGLDPAPIPLQNLAIPVEHIPVTATIPIPEVETEVQINERD